MWRFISILILFGHNRRDTIKAHWTTDPLLRGVYGDIMSRNRFIHIMRYLHFADGPNSELDRTDKLFKIREIFDCLCERFRTLYNPGESLAIDEVIVSFKGRVSFKQYIPTKRHKFGIKVYRVCDCTGYTVNMSVYTGAVRRATNEETATERTVLDLCRSIESVSHHLYMDNWFSSPALFRRLRNRGILCCGTVRSSRRGMPSEFKKNNLGSLDLQSNDVRCRVSDDDLTALIIRDKRVVRLLSTIHTHTDEGRSSIDVDGHGSCGQSW
jgi:hypothetical protein